MAERFVVEQLAGIGGMSEVYRARDDDGRAVAIKVLKSLSGHLVERFTREIQALAHLHHDAIVRYLGRGVTPDTGRHFLIMEWLEGVELGVRLRRDRLDLDSCLRLGERMADALGVAHATGIVHRDVKPNNIFLCSGSVDHAKLLDFGIARWHEAGILTKTGARFGTPAYMSPEQVRGDRDLDTRADVFSLGCVLFECLTGRPPFDATDNMAIFGKILFQGAPRLADELPSMPEPVDQLLQRMLAREPDMRPGDGIAVAAQIRVLREELSGQDLQRTYHPARPRRDTLTNQEQRLVSVVVATLDPGDLDVRAHGTQPAARPETSGLADTMVPALADAPSRAGGDAPGAGPGAGSDSPAGNGRAAGSASTQAPRPTASSLLQLLRARFDELGARFQLLDNGLLVAVLESGDAAACGTAVDQASHAARCALALQSAAPAAPVALATGRIVVGRERLVGEVIERAVALLGTQALALRHDATLLDADGGAPTLADQDGASPNALPDARIEARPAARDEPGARFATGDSAGERAGRDQGATAQSIGIRVDEVTALLLRERFRIEGDGPRGFSLVGEVRRESPQQGGAAVLAEGRLPFVGRRGEMATLMASLDECMEDGVARAVLITGPAGYGKSRLCDEFLARIGQGHGAPVVWMAHGDPARGGSPLHLLATAIRGAADIVEGAPRAASRALLRARVVRHVDAAEVDRVTAFLCELLQLSDPEHDDVQIRAAQMSAQLMGDQMRRACLDLLAAEVAAHPVLFVLEDLHWGDRASIEVLDVALRALTERPFLIVALGRPEAHDLFPGLWSAHDITEIRLHRLSRRAAERLVRAGTGDELTPAQVTALVERADGNPYYLEELIRRGPTSDSLPETVAVMVDARLGALAPEARWVLRAASLFGRVFWEGGIKALVGEGVNVTEWLDTLVALELVAPVPTSRFPGERELVFRHDLLREGAYAMLTAEDCRLGHRLAAAWLEAAGEQDARLLAMHFDCGGVPGRALPFYVRAAERALAGSDFDGAMDMVQRGLICGAAGELLGALRRVQMEEQIWRGNNAEVARLGSEAMELLPRGSRVWFDVLGEVAAAWGKLGRAERLDEMVDALEAEPGADADRIGRLVAMAKVSVLCFAFGQHARAEELLATVESESRALERDLPVLAAHMHFGRAFRAETVLADPAAMLHEFEQCVACFEAIGDLRHACLHRSNAGYARLELGLFEEAEGELQAALERAQQQQLDFVANCARQALGLVLAHRGKLAEARTLEAEALAWFAERQDLRMAVLCRLYLAAILVLDGNLDGAERETRGALAELSEYAPLRPMALASLARISLERGQVDQVVAPATAAVALLDSLDNVEIGEAFVRLVHAEALHVSGAHEPARAAIAEARDRLLARAGRISRDDWRQSFLESVPDHARTLALARSWLG